ncbi:MAG: hypothetical protein AAB215_01635, partial [Planctomycetota bacterium]
PGREKAIWVRVQFVDRDRRNTEERWITFTVDRPVRVIFGMDNRIKSFPTWMQGFQPTGEKIKAPVRSSRATFVFHAKNFPAGEIVIGGARASGWAGDPWCIVPIVGVEPLP